MIIKKLSETQREIKKTKTNEHTNASFLRNSPRPNLFPQNQKIHIPPRNHHVAREYKLFSDLPPGRTQSVDSENLKDF